MTDTPRFDVKPAEVCKLTRSHHPRWKLLLGRPAGAAGVYKCHSLQWTWPCFGAPGQLQLRMCLDPKTTNSWFVSTGWQKFSHLSRFSHVKFSLWSLYVSVASKGFEGFAGFSCNKCATGFLKQLGGQRGWFSLDMVELESSMEFSFIENGCPTGLYADWPRIQ